MLKEKSHQPKRENKVSFYAIIIKHFQQERNERDNHLTVDRVTEFKKKKKIQTKSKLISELKSTKNIFYEKQEYNMILILT